MLFVCTGSVCRAPMAERLTRAGLSVWLGSDARRIVVESAGTWGHEGAPMEPHAAETLLAYGGDPHDFAGRELSHEHVAAADVVLTAAREHRTHVIALDPGSIRRVFTIKEFGRLAGAVDLGRLPEGDVVERARVLVGEAAALRRRVRARWPEDDDVADPYGAPAHMYRDCAAEIVDALGPLLATLGRAPQDQRRVQFYSPG